MHRTHLALGGLVGLILLLPGHLALSQEQAGSLPVSLRVYVPSNAQLFVEGARTQQGGEVRRFQSPPLAVGQNYVYTLRITWMEGGQERSAEKKVNVRPGQETVVDLRAPQGTVTQVKAAEAQEQPRKRPKLDVPYVPTPQVVVDKMLELASVTKNDVVYDLGCGDGRIVVTAAKKYGAKAVGVDLDPERVREALANVKKADVGNLVQIREGNALKTDVSAASVVTLYLLPEVNLKLRPTLQKQLKPGSRIVSHDFDMGDWQPLKQVMLNDEDGQEHTVYLWIVGQEAPKGEAPAKPGSQSRLAAAPAPTLLALRDGADEPQLDVPYVPTPQDVVEKMLELAEVKKGDVVYDLGCGDGRIVVTAAKKYGVRGLGVDLDPERVKDSLANVKKEGVEKLVEIRQGDVFKVDVSPASVVTLYLLPEVNLKLRPTLLKQLKPGSRIVSHDFDMGDWTPLKKIEVQGKNGRQHTLYLWKIEGNQK
jgi:uncharacterized protein (TIGR03000 family)